MKFFKHMKLILVQIQLDDCIITGNRDRARKLALEEARLRAELLPL